jgi:hypothetical protein
LTDRWRDPPATVQLARSISTNEETQNILFEAILFGPEILPLPHLCFESTTLGFRNDEKKHGGDHRLATNG